MSGSAHPGLMVVDWSNMVHRAFHAMGGTDAVTSTDILYRANKMAQDAANSVLYTGAAVVHVMDGGLSGRDKIYPDYKANRVTHDDRPISLTTAIGATHLVNQSPQVGRIPLVRVDGYEADDVMANMAWAYSMVFPGSPCFILSNDKDLFQVCSKGVSVLRHKGTGEHGIFGMEIVTPDIVEERYGFPPQKIIDYKALQGDVADNIPSVPRIGHGVACRLVQQWGGAKEAVAAAVQDLMAPKFTDALKSNLIQHREVVYLNLRLVRLVAVPEAKGLLSRVLAMNSPVF